MPNPTADLSQTFEAERRRLFGIAYRMLGSVSEADDIVQEAWIRVSSHTATIETPEAFLTTVTTRLAIDRLRSAQKRRETYVGPWLPEPLLTGASHERNDPAHIVELDESITLGFLYVLERLGPVDRAVFLLREVFDLGYDEIADIVDRSEDACRQIAKRSRDRVRSEKPKFAVERERRQELLDSFLHTLLTGDTTSLASKLADDVVVISDGGADHRAARKPIVGRDRVTMFVTNLMARQPEGSTMEFVEANGELAAVLVVDGRIKMLSELEFDGDKIRRVHTMVNPEKLVSVQAALDSGGDSV